MNRLAGVLAVHTCQPMKEKCKELEVNHLQVKSARVQNKRSCQPNNTLRPSPPLSFSECSWKDFSSEHYLLLICIEVDIVGSICLLSRFLIVQETTQEEVVVNPTTRSDQTHPCLFLWWQVKRHPPRAFWMDYLSSIWVRVDVVCCICLLSLLLIAGWSHLAQCYMLCHQQLSTVILFDTTQEEVFVKWCSVFEHQCEWSWLQIFISVIVRISFEQQVARYLCGSAQFKLKRYRVETS